MNFNRFKEHLELFYNQVSYSFDDNFFKKKEYHFDSCYFEKKNKKK